MGIPKKGSRPITMDGVKYVWRIRRKATSLQNDYGAGCLHVAMALAAGKGQTLIAATDFPHSKDWGSVPPVTPITPRHIAEWIRQALQLGWRPESKGSPFCITIFNDAVKAEKIHHLHHKKHTAQ